MCVFVQGGWGLYKCEFLSPALSLADHLSTHPGRVFTIVIHSHSNAPLFFFFFLIPLCAAATSLYLHSIYNVHTYIYIYL